MSGRIVLATNEISVSEREEFATVTIRREGDASRPVEISYEVTPDTATLGSDFQGGFGTATIPAGADRTEVRIPILDDTASEPTESLVLALINVSSGSLGTSRTVRVDILDDENPVDEPANPPLTSPFVATQEAVITGVDNPLDFEVAPSGLVYVAQKNGLVIAFDAEGNRQGTVLDLRDEVNDRQDRGLLDVALHPDFPEQPFLYASYVVDPPEAADLTGNAGQNGGGNRYAHLVRYTVSDDGLSVVPGSGTIILGGAGRSYADVSGEGALDFTNPDQADRVASDRLVTDDPFQTVVDGFVQDYWKVDSRSHAGGAISFGPEGALYLTTGDGTSYNYADPRTVDVQSLNGLSGKVLRIDPITGRGLADNPFVEPGDDLSLNKAKVYASGLRNPFSMGFDEDGRLFLTDTGWGNYEEVNQAVGGDNFGWPYYEGGDGGTLLPTRLYRDTPDAQAFYQAVEAGEVDVSAAYRAFSHRDADPGIQVQAITGGNAFFADASYPEQLQGDYIFTDVSQGEVFAVDTDDRREVSFLYDNPAGFGPVHFGEGPDGLVWYADLASNTVGRLRIEDPNAGPPAPQPPAPQPPAPEPEPPTPDPEPGNGRIVAAVNAGGGAVTTNGVAFAADNSFTESNTFTDGTLGDSVQSAFQGTIYETERWGKEFSYSVADLDPNQDYVVELHFAEIWWDGDGPGQRVFDAAIEGNTVLDELDLNARTGGADEPVVFTSQPLRVGADGTLNVAFSTTTDNAKVSGIIVREAGGSATPGTPPVPEPPAPEPPAPEPPAPEPPAPDPTPEPPVGGTEVIGEVGLASVSTTGRDVWTRVEFAQALDDPIVVAGPPTTNGGQAGMIRVRDVSSTGFEMQMEEWAYLDGWHVPETVSWMAIERGEHQIGGGRVIAGSSSVSDAASTVEIGTSLDAPVVLGQVASRADGAPVTHRISDVGGESFRVRLQEEEGSADRSHAQERFDWIALENGVSGPGIEVGRTADAAVSDVRFDLSFDSPKTDVAFFADMQTINGGDPSALRLDNLRDGGATVFVQEEQSGDEEVTHTYPEQVAWFTTDTGLLLG